MYNTEFLRELRHSKGLNKKDMGALIGFSKSNYQKLENGEYKQIPINALAIIKNEFQLDAQEVLELMGLNK